MSDKLIGILVAIACLGGVGWTLRQSRPGPHGGWRASHPRRGYVYNPRRRKRGQ